MINATDLQRLETTAASEGIDRLVVGAAIRHGHTVLLLERSADDFMGGIYELPSGKVEPGETLDAALTREVAEETGLEAADIVDYLGHFDYISGSGKLTRQLNFTVVVPHTDHVTLTEHVGYLWVPLDGELPVTDAVRDILRKAS